MGGSISDPTYSQLSPIYSSPSRFRLNPFTLLHRPRPHHIFLQAVGVVLDLPHAVRCFQRPDALPLMTVQFRLPSLIQAFDVIKEMVSLALQILHKGK